MGSICAFISNVNLINDFAHAQAIWPFLLREAAARGLLEVVLRRRLRKSPTDYSSHPSKEGREQQLRQVFIIVIIKYR